MNPKQLIADLRGGYPPTCSWCDQPTPPEKLEPEEAGEWVCWDCIDKFEKETKTRFADGQPIKE